MLDKEQWIDFRNLVVSLVGTVIFMGIWLVGFFNILIWFIGRILTIF